MARHTIAAASLTLASALLTPLSYAACPSETIFACTTTTEKVVEVCESSKTVDYSFGKKNAKPEIALSVPKSSVTSRQWNGIGRNMYFSVLIPNGKTVYEVFSNVDKFDEETSHGIYILVSGKEVAAITCKPHTITDNIPNVTFKNAPEE